MQKQKGFTIIELIVVIAIIAVLAGIILVSVTQYNVKAKNAAIKAQMKEYYIAQTQNYERDGYYSYCMDNTEPCAIASEQIWQQGGEPWDGIPAWPPQKYCLQALLVDGTKWCVDSTGYVGPIATGCQTNNTYKCN